MSKPWDRIDVTELSDYQLSKTPTWQKYHAAEGVCSGCSEPTNMLYRCCSDPVLFEGAMVDGDDLWFKIEQELMEASEPDPDTYHDEKGLYDEAD